MNQSSKKHIVISSYGSISALGHEKDRIIENCNLSKSFLSSVSFNNKHYFAGKVSPETELYVSDFIKSDVKLKRLDRSVILALIATDIAMKTAKLDFEKNRIGVSIGSSRGATGLFEKYHQDYLSHNKNETALLTSPLTTLGNISSSVAQYIGSKGFVMSHSMTCSTALQALTNAVAWLKADMADCFIVGGAEAPLTNFTFAQVEALGIYSKNTNTEFHCQPLTSDENPKNTMTLGEGAAIFVVEKKHESELQKGDIIVESVGFGFEEIPSATGLSEKGDTLVSSMKMALESLTGKTIDAIVTHSPGTVKGDAAEYAAIEHVFGANKPILFNNKWIIGHTYGASGALNLETAILLLKGEIEPKLPYPHRFANKLKPINCVMTNAAGFGGNSSSIILSTCK
ncbi:MAG: beta-ketoacyl synthase N-terminal-like domain-containing protein [Bacteroidota bacterium]